MLGQPKVFYCKAGTVTEHSVRDATISINPNIEAGLVLGFLQNEQIHRQTDLSNPVDKVS